MELPKYFIGCDWGTTNFRLKLVDTATLKVLAEYRTDQGVKALYEKFRLQKDVDQQGFFTEYLLKQLERFPNEHRKHIVVASGMASSSIGLCELEYAEIPYTCSGETLNWKLMALREGQDLLVISGVKDRTGMMRGEEVQSIGLEAHFAHCQSGVLLLPGTHSKHLSFKSGQFYALKNYMTGELFELLTRKSILSNSIHSGENKPLRKSAFEEGMHLGLKGMLTSSLLSVRAKDVVQNLDREDNYFFLSGLLIGDELSYLRNVDEKVVLAAPESVCGLYKIVLERIVDHDKLTVLDNADLEKALLLGQKKILKYAK